MFIAWITELVCLILMKIFIVFRNIKTMRTTQMWEEVFGKSCNLYLNHNSNHFSFRFKSGLKKNNSCGANKISIYCWLEISYFLLYWLVLNFTTLRIIYLWHLARAFWYALHESQQNWDEFLSNCQIVLPRHADIVTDRQILWTTKDLE